MSKIEEGVHKIDRIERECRKIDLPENVIIEFLKEDYNGFILELKSKLSKLGNNERVLIFLDPYGYKDINPNDLKQLMENKKTEIILFLPIDFMYRFITKSEDEEFISGIHLRNLIRTLFSNNINNFNNEKEFIVALEKRFHTYLQVFATETFPIEKEKNKYFSLFYLQIIKKDIKYG